MDVLEVTTKLERIELMAKVAFMEDVTKREQHIALLLIGVWAKELNADIREDMKKPRCGGISQGSRFQ